MSTVYVKDLVERVVVTFLEAWFAAWLVVADQRLADLFDSKTLMVGVTAAVGALVKALAARRVGAEESASLAPDV